MRTRALLAVLLLVGCGSGGSTELELELTPQGPFCNPTPLTQTMSVSVELYGSTGGSRCLLGRRCAPFDQSLLVQSPDVKAIELALRRLSQPLVSAPRRSVEGVGVFTHTAADCGGTRLMCGVTTIDGANANGEATVPIDCGTGTGPTPTPGPACTEPTPPACP